MNHTITDIAKMANVSKATVSRVINNKAEGVGPETRERILKIIHETGFQPSAIARGLVTKKTKSIGLLIPDITNPFFPQLVRGAEDYANQRGYHLFLCNTERKLNKEKNYLTALIEKSVDGIILTSNYTAAGSQINVLKNSKVPFVLLDRYFDNSDGFPGVYLDNFKGAYMATRYFLSHGHRNIVFMSGPLAVTTSKNRFHGYQQAHADEGLTVNLDLVKEGDFGVESGYCRIMELIHEKRIFSAVFTGNDMMAIGAIKALRENGLNVPDTIEIIGFDNIAIAELLDPPLSTVAQPIYKMGHLGAKLLINQIEGKKLARQNIVLEPELYLRGTTR